MNKKNKPDTRGFVFSTDPNFRFDNDPSSQDTLTPKEQKLRIRLETKHRAGKAVTVIAGFVGKEEDAETLAKQLKNLCGSGGSVKDLEIIVQGDHREKIKQWLLKNGYGQTK
jgi:translation initiation factor 1